MTPAALTTSDGGLDWQSGLFPSGSVGGLEAASCVSTLDCWAVGSTNPNGYSDPEAFGTTNGGLTWAAETLPSASSGGLLDGISCLVVSGSDDCWAAGQVGSNSAVYETTNGGSSWSLSSSFWPSNPPFVTISCVNNSGTVSCWTASNAYGLTIFTTANGGSSWSTQTTPSGATEFNTISCVVDSGSNYCWATGSVYGGSVPAAGIFKMSGGSWSDVTLLGAWYSTTGISCVSASDCQITGMIDDWGSSYVLTGAVLTWNGSSWSAGITVSGTTVTNTTPGSMEDGGASAVACPSASDCYAVGREGIMATQNGGSSWFQSYFTPLRSGDESVACPTTTVCYWAPGDDVVYKSVDGGQSWAPESLPATVAYDSSYTDGPVNGVRAISCNDALHCALAGSVDSQHSGGSDPIVLTTSDGGNTWSTAIIGEGDSNHSPDYEAVTCPPGVTWCLWTGAYWSGHGTSAIGGYTGGSTANLPTPGSSDSGWSDASCANASDCWIVGEDGSYSTAVIYATTNGGSTWSSQTPPSGFAVNSGPQISCPTSSVCYADGGDNSSMMNTTNEGSTWSGSTLGSYWVANQLSCSDASDCVSSALGGSWANHVLALTSSGWSMVTLPSPGASAWGAACVDDSSSTPSCWAVGGDSAGSGMVFSTNGIAAPEGGGITLSEALGGPNGLEPCFSCALKARGEAAQAFVGEPVNTATGDFYESLPLFSLPGRGVPISFTLTYDAAGSQSQVEAGDTSPGPDGWGWTDNYSGLGVSIDSSSYFASVHDATGSEVTFVPSSLSACPSSYTPQAPRVTASLSCSTSGSDTIYALSTNGGLEVDTFTYNSSSQLTEITQADANGNTTTILPSQQGSNSSGANYNTACPSSATTCTVVSDPASRTFVLAYNSTGQLASAIDPDGNSSGHTWSFSYDAYGNLASITDRNGEVTSFGYDTSNTNTALVHDMTAMTPPNGQSGGPDAGDAWAISYDALGRVSTQTDPKGLETTFSYTGNNLSPEGGTTTITDPHGNVTVQTYAYGMLTSTTTGVGTSSPATWTYIRDPVTLLPTSVIDPDGNVTTTTYDSDGNALTVTDAVGNETTSTYNSFNEPLTVTDPVGIETVNTYDSHGDLTEKAVDGLSSTDISTTYTVCQTSCPSGYVAGDVESMTDPNGKTTTYTYDSYGDLASSSITVGSLTDVTSDSYNTLGELYCEVSPDANAASVSCPSFGATRHSDTTTYAYDADGNMTSTTDADGNTTSDTYDADNNRTTVTDPIGNVTKTVYDADDRIATVTDGYGTGSATTTTYTYDIAPGSCSSAPTGTTYCTEVENGLSNTTTSYYDAFDHMIEQAPPNTTAQSTTTYSYDGVGNVLTATDASGSTTYSYDDDNRVTAIAYSATASGYTQPHSVSYSYDADGNRTQMVDGTGTTTYGYDGLERLDSVENGASNTVTYKYDDDGNPTCLSYPNSGSTTCLNSSSGTGLVSYEYNEANQVKQMTDWLGGGNITSFTYDHDGNLTGTTYPSGTTTSANHTYDNADQITDTSYTIGSATTDLAALTPTADETIATTTPPGGSPLTYGYDSLNRVTTGTTAGYTYDAASEIKSITPTGGSATDYSYNTDGQLCWTATTTGSCSSPPSGATTFSYSSVGGRLSATPSGSNPTTYGWDQAGNLVCETAPNSSSYSCSSPHSTVTTTYGYNGDGLRMSDTPAGGSTQQFTWDVSGSVPQLLEDGANYYLYGPNTGSGPLEQISISGSTPTYLVSDTTGVREQIGSTGSVVGSMSYDSYGNQCSICSISTPFGFEGGYTDATGLIYLVRRYYDPATSQFLSVDPLVNETGTPYAFTGGDPVNGTDSSGLGSLWNPCSWGNVCHHIGNVVNGVTSSSAYTWFNQHLNPAYLALTGYHNEWQATESGCSLSTELKYGGQGVLGVAGTLGAAGGGELLGGVRALGPLDETGAVGVGFSGDQRALVQLAKLAKQTGGVTQEEAQTLVDWADETGLQSSGPEIHLGRPGWGGQNVHIQIGPVNHIPVLP